MPKVARKTPTSFPIFLYTEEEYYGLQAMNSIKTDRIDLKFLTVLLNSRFSYFWLKNKRKELGDSLQIDKGAFLNILLMKPNEKTQNEIALLVKKAMEFFQDYRNTSVNNDKWHNLKNEIEEIDQEVYELYRLTTEEIKTI